MPLPSIEQCHNVAHKFMSAHDDQQAEVLLEMARIPKREWDGGEFDFQAEAIACRLNAHVNKQEVADVAALLTSLLTYLKDEKHVESTTRRSNKVVRRIHGRNR